MARGGDNRPENQKGNISTGGKNYTVLKRVPSPPKFLDAAGIQLFKDLAGELIKAGRMQRVDIEPLATYCDLRSRYVELKERLKDGDTYETSNGSIVPIPEVKMLKDVIMNLKHYEQYFMFIPLTRLRNKVGADVKDIEEYDPVLSFLKKAE